ncbi:hypothetical protein TNCV_4389941 [Trichonephila clavipes]|nr:hypothetical protein TNCV_4389941 [Trichonephila clavipes]
MLNSSLTSIENLRNNFANIKEEAIGLAKKWGITPEFEKKRHRKVRVFFDYFNADEKLQDRERLFEVDVFKVNVDVITTQLKNRFESMNGIVQSVIVSTLCRECHPPTEHFRQCFDVSLRFSCCCSFHLGTACE